MDVWISLSLTAIAVILLPLLRALINTAKKQQRIEDSLSALIKNVEKLVEDKDKVHAEIITQMREDRNATNLRLRWLEERIWGTGNGNGRR